jgi:hypothetical protein
MKHLLLTLTLTLLPTSALATTCPTEFQPLITRLLKDLPSYTNRIALRSRPLDQTRTLPQILSAGRPEYEPLPEDNTQEDPTLKQVFFTTLERRTLSKTTLTHQHFHRLLLTDTRYGWRMIALYSRNSNGTDTPQPPIETSTSDLGQGIALWLRDCPEPKGKTPVR